MGGAALASELMARRVTASPAARRREQCCLPSAVHGGRGPATLATGAFVSASFSVTCWVSLPLSVLH